MKRYIAGLACAAAAVLSAPALASTAHAEAADPLTALRSQFNSGRGVTFVDKTKIQGKAGNTVVAQRDGTFQFGTSGIAASDQTGKLRIKESDLVSDSDDEEGFLKGFAGLAKPERVIRINKASYISGGYFGEFLPEGKSWLRYPSDSLGFVGIMSQQVNVAEPATLKALLAHATTKRPGLYAGKITFGELHKVSPWFRASLSGAKITSEAKVVMSWKLFVGANQLPERLTTSYSDSASASSVTTVDTRYSGWGSKVTIKAPAAEDIATVKELEAGAETNVPIPIQVK